VKSALDVVVLVKECMTEPDAYTAKDLVKSVQKKMMNLKIVERIMNMNAIVNEKKITKYD
jgi:hypothetical protein